MPRSSRQQADPVRSLRSSHAYRVLAAQVRREDHTCWLCHKPIDVRIPYRDPATRKVNPLSWSLDHVIPLAIHPELGLDRELMRAAHLGCNSARGKQSPTRPKPVPLRTSRTW